MPFLPRPRRIPMLGGRVHLSRGFADLVNLSRSGVLIRTNYAMRVGSDWPLTLRLQGQSADLLGQVVRCESTDVRLPAGAALRHQFGIAFRFTDISPEAEALLLVVCGTKMEDVGPR